MGALRTCSSILREIAQGGRKFTEKVEHGLSVRPYSSSSPIPPCKHCEVYDSEVTVICCGESLSHVVGLKPVKDAKRFQLDPTIHDSEVSILFVSRNYQSRPSVYLYHT